MSNRAQISGVTYDGGYAEYMLAPAQALALTPEGLSAVDAGPLMCAEITTFNALRNSGARPGDTVAVLGVGGLGRLAIQFAAKRGFRSHAITLPSPPMRSRCLRPTSPEDEVRDRVSFRPVTIEGATYAPNDGYENHLGRILQESRSRNSLRFSHS